MSLNPHAASLLAQAVLGIHIAIAAFIVFFIVAIPLGARLGWLFIRLFWLRIAHVLAMAFVAGQKALGESCFLSVWERQLVDIANQVPHQAPFFQSLGERVLYWNLPLWFFTWLYALLFAFVIALWFVVPPKRTAELRLPT